MKNKNKQVTAVALGLIFGILVGVITKNIGLWLGLGIAIGAGVGNSLMHHDNKKVQDDSTPKKQVKVNFKSTSI